MNHKATTVILFFLLFQCQIWADWKEDVSQLLRENKNYSEVVKYLIDQSDKIKEFDPVHSGLLAFCYSNLGEKEKEHKWLEKYFENYRGAATIFSFLDYSIYMRILDYIQRWRQEYPFIKDVSLIDREYSERSAPPSFFVVAVEIENDAYYRLRQDEKTIQGGLFQPGFNTFKIETEGLFSESALHTFDLDLKKDGLIIHKKIQLDIKIKSEKRLAPSKAKILKSPEFVVSMYIGDKLVVMSKKLPPKNLNLTVKNPPWPENREPYLPPQQRHPLASSVSILDAINAISKAIKEFRKDKDEMPSRPLRVRKRLSFTYKGENTEEGEEQISADVRILMTHKIN